MPSGRYVGINRGSVLVSLGCLHMAECYISTPELRELVLVQCMRSCSTSLCILRKMMGFRVCYCCVSCKLDTKFDFVLHECSVLLQ